MFRSVMRILQIIRPSVDLTPDFMMSDLSPAISNAITETFPDCRTLNCRFHFWNLIAAKLKSKKYFPKDKRYIDVKKAPLKF